MNVLLTGSSGFLGKYIHRYLHSEGFNIITIGRSPSNHINVDLSKNQPFLSSDINTVIHAAGCAHINLNTKSVKDLHYQVNVIGTKNLLKAVNKNIASFIFISSVSVYGLTSGVLINEESPFLAKDPYGLSKIQAEYLIQEWCYKHDVRCTILRLPLIAGQNPPGNLGSMITGIKKGYYFNIAGGLAKKSIVLAEDIAKYIPKMAEIGGVYNLTDGYHPTFIELSLCIAKQLNKNFIPNMPFVLAKAFAKTGDFVGDRFPINTDRLLKITSTLTFNDSKAKEAFDWNPSPVLDAFKI